MYLLFVTTHLYFVNRMKCRVMVHIRYLRYKFCQLIDILIITMIITFDGKSFFIQIEYSERVHTSIFPDTAIYTTEAGRICMPV